MDEVDLARSREYALLSRLLLQSPDRLLLNQLGQLESDGTSLGEAHAALAEASRRLNPDKIAREYFELFTGVGRGEILPYASFYLTGSLHGRPLASLRQTLQELGIERNTAITEPEDHAGVLCEIMAAMLGGSIPSRPDETHRFYAGYVAPWMGRLFRDLENSQSADFYSRVGTIGRTFLEIESDALKLPLKAS